MPQVRWARHLELDIEDEYNRTVAPYVQQERRWEKVERFGKLVLLSTLGLFSLSILLRLVKTLAGGDASQILLGGPVGINVTQTFERFWDAYEAVLEPTLEDDLFSALVDFDIPIAESKSSLVKSVLAHHPGTERMLDTLLRERVRARDLVRERWADYTARRSAALREIAENGQLFHDHLGSRLLGRQRGDADGNGERFRHFFRRAYGEPKILAPSELRNETSAVLRLGLENILGHFGEPHDGMMLSLVYLHRAMESFRSREARVLDVIWKRARLAPPRNRRIQEAQTRTRNLVTQLGNAGDDLKNRRLTRPLGAAAPFAEPVEVMLRNWGARVRRIQAGLDTRGTAFRKGPGFDYAEQIRRWKDQHHRALCPPSWAPQRVVCLLESPRMSENSTQAREVISKLGKLSAGPGDQGPQPASMWEICCRVLFRH